MGAGMRFAGQGSLALDQHRLGQNPKDDQQHYRADHRQGLFVGAGWEV
jgi:hypothetical protein